MLQLLHFDDGWTLFPDEVVVAAAKKKNQPRCLIRFLMFCLLQFASLQVELVTPLFLLFSFTPRFTLLC